MDAPWYGATKTEFRLRFFSGWLIYVVASACYLFDGIPAGLVVGRWLHSWTGAATEDMWVRAMLLAAAAFTFLGAAIRTWGTSYLTSAVVFAQRLHSDKLIADGPFRYVRNPLYFGNILIAFGLGLTLSRTGFFVAFFGMFVWVMRLILREEAELRETQGESYRAYCSAVPRLVPSLRARVPPADAKPNWVDGILREFFWWGATLAVVLLALTSNGEISEWVFFASFVVWIIMLVTRRNKKQTLGNAS
jgi:protein-S-isoprenylcysteine O-methyltransferase Ste14